MTIGINEIESGMGLLIDGQIYIVTEYSHVKPGKGSAFVRVRLKNLKTDLSLERTYRSSEALEDINLEERRVVYQYRAGKSFHFMDQSTYEEVVIDEDRIGDGVKYLQDNLQVTVVLYNHQVQKVILPTFIESQIIATEPGIRGDSSRSGNKPGTIDTGATVQVPLFINIGDFVKIDTRTGQYVERLQR